MTHLFVSATFAAGTLARFNRNVASIPALRNRLAVPMTEARVSQKCGGSKPPPGYCLENERMEANMRLLLWFQDLIGVSHPTRSDVKLIRNEEMFLPADVNYLEEGASKPPR